MSTLNASSMFASAYYGLQNAYQFALKDGTDGITQSDLFGLNNKYGYVQNSAFSSYMATNFKQLDKNSDGKINGEEMSSVMNTFSKQGMTYDQLVSLSGSAGVNSNDLNTVLNNFRKIDRNGDGRVSQTEIQYFNANKQITNKLDELKKSRRSDISIMYSDDNDDDDDTSSSFTSVSSVI